MNTSKPFFRIIAWALFFVMIFTTAQISAGAEFLPMGASGEIIAFDSLPEGTANQTVPLGTKMKALKLPSTLTATVLLSSDNENETATPSRTEEPQTVTGSVPVTWESSPDYDGDTSGTYIFTAVVEDFAVSAALPEITVNVSDTAVSGGLITAFDPLPEDIRFQRDYSPNLPETVSGTVYGEAADIPVTWYAEGYDAENYTGGGLFAFSATPVEGYTLGGDVSAPTIAYFKLPLINPMMAGQGTSTAPLQIVSAAQLFEIAALTNAGKLESTILGSSSAQVHMELANDIDLTAYQTGDGWVPIGTSSNPFKGVFDGGDYTITGLYINRAADNNGLFGYVDGGEVKNLGVEGVSVTGGNNVGGVAGYMASGTIEKCYSTIAINGGSYVGGIVGNAASGTVSYCAALNPSVSGTGDVGRVAGAGSGLSDNVAFIGMKGGDFGAIADSASDKNGESKTATELLSLGGGYLLPNPLPAYIVDSVTDPNFLGAGISSDPFLINTAAELAKLAELVNANNTTYNASGVCYLLTADLDLSGYGAGYNGGKGWIPIGHQDTGSLYFKGNFDGNGFKITGLYINSTGYDNTGLFGAVDGGTISNLGLEGVNITGKEFVGSVAGDVRSGTVQNCYATGAVTGRGIVGGVAGGVDSGTVRNCYSACTVESTSDCVGGVAGWINNGGAVENCYSTGAVTGNGIVGGVAGHVAIGTVENCAALNPSVTATGSNVGRVVGLNDGGSLSGNAAFSGMTLIGATTSSDAAGIHGADLALAAIIEDIGGRFTAVNGWTEPTAAQTAYLPGLFGALVEKPAHLLDSASPFGGGNGTSAANAYEISTAAQLAMLAQLVNAGTAPYAELGKHYKLMNDIDLSGYSSGAGWIPIGSSSSFRGNFDGDGNTITGLYINRTANYTGLFGSISGSSSGVKNLILENVSVTSTEDYTGGVAGQVSLGKVQNCAVSGSVTGTGDSTGGVVGAIAGTASMVENCAVSGSVDGYRYVGGVAGQVTNGGKVQNCYSTANITATGISYGGVVGAITGTTSTVESCYTTGTVSGAYQTGGVVGYFSISSHIVRNCVALNPSVTSDSNARRVVTSNANISNNYAFSGMTDPGIGKFGAERGDTTQNGADMTSGDALTATFWTSTMGWTDGGSPWTIVDGYLPYFGTAKVDSGLYLTTRTLEFAEVTVTGTYTYNGSAQTPALTVTFDGATLVEGTDYTYAITSSDGAGTSAGTNAGTVTITVTGAGNYQGTATQTFTINPKNLSGVTVVANFPATTYSGSAQSPAPTSVSFDGTIVSSGADYTLGAYSNNTNAGTASIVINGTGNYTGTATVNFTIAPKNLSGVTVAANFPAVTYSGSAQTPTPTSVTFDGTAAALTTDYTIGSYTNNTNAGTANAVITGTGNYTGTASVTFTIGVKSLTLTADNKTILVNDSEPAYTYTVSGLVGGDTAAVITTQPSMSVATFNSSSPTTFTIVITGGATTNTNYTIGTRTNGTLTVTTKTPVTVSGISVTGKTYDGAAINYSGTPIANDGINNVNPSGYTYEWQESNGTPLAGNAAPTDAGDYKLVVSVDPSDPNYIGSETYSFTISKRPLTVRPKSESMIVGGTLPTFALEYVGIVNGESITPSVTPAFSCTGDGSSVGSFPITWTNETATTFTGDGNYNVTKQATGTLTVAMSGGTGAHIFTNRTLTNTATGVKVTASMTAGTQLNVTANYLHTAGSCKACDEIRARQAAGDLLALYDISLTGYHKGAYEVFIPFSGSDGYYTVLHCNKGVLEQQCGTYNSGGVSTTWAKLSPFAVVKGVNVMVPDHLVVDPPKTGDAGSPLGIVMVVVGLVALAGLRVARKKAARQ